MECPNCRCIMDGLGMSGNEEHIKHELYCNHCHTYLAYSYNPKVTDRILNKNNNTTEEGLPY